MAGVFLELIMFHSKHHFQVRAAVQTYDTWRPVQCFILNWRFGSSTSRRRLFYTHYLVSALPSEGQEYHLSSSSDSHTPRRRCQAGWRRHHFSCPSLKQRSVWLSGLGRLLPATAIVPSLRSNRNSLPPSVRKPNGETRVPVQTVKGVSVR